MKNLDYLFQKTASQYDVLSNFYDDASGQQQNGRPPRPDGYLEGWAGTPDQTMGFYKFIDVPSDGIALDGGCGVGRATGILARICKKAIGTDLSQGMLALAKKNAAGAQLIHGNLLEVLDEIKPDSIDFIQLNAMIHCMPNELARILLEKCHRAIRKSDDAKIAISTTIHPTFDEGEKVRESPRAEVPKIIRWRTEYDLATLDDTLTNSGFADLRNSLVMTKPHKVMTVPTAMIISKPSLKSKYIQVSQNTDRTNA